MNIKPNTPTRSTPPCSGEQAGSDTNNPKQYRVALALHQSFCYVFMLNANSPEEAERRAKLIASCDLDAIPRTGLHEEVMVGSIETVSPEVARRFPRVTKIYMEE